MKMRKINKKSEILIPETVRIVIAVLCIVILIYLAYKLYSLFTTKTELEQARETLEQIVGKINLLKEGEIYNYLTLVPSDWFIVYYKQGENSPSICNNKNCLCMCEYDWGFSTDIPYFRNKMKQDISYCNENKNIFNGEGVKNCGSDGVCIQVSYQIEIAPWCYQIISAGKSADPIQLNWIWLMKENLPMKLYLSKLNNQIVIGKEIPKGVMQEESVETGILDKFISQEIQDSGETLSMGKFISYHLAGNCSDPDFKKDFLNLDANGGLNDPNREIIINSFKEYIKSHKFNENDLEYSLSGLLNVSVTENSETKKDSVTDSLLLSKTLKEFGSGSYKYSNEKIIICKNEVPKDNKIYSIEYTLNFKVMSGINN